MTHGNATWTDEKIERLRELVAAATPVRQIADTFGVTRNAILGLMHRKNIPAVRARGYAFAKGAKGSRRKPLKSKILMYDGWRSTPQTVSHAHTEPDQSATVPHAVEAYAAAADIPGLPGGVSIFDLAPESCRYPCTGEGVSILYCGAASVDGHSWCGRHLQVVYRPRAA
jgi:hypothetical protein